MSDSLKGAASVSANPAADTATGTPPAHGIIVEIEAFIRKVEDDVGHIPSEAWRLVKTKLSELKSVL